MTNNIPEVMKVVAVEEPKKIEIKSVATPKPAEGEVLIKIDSCLLCTWEQRIFSGKSSMALPFIPGHEAAGTIVAINPDTPTSFKVGDKVTFKTLDHCGHCYFCYQGFDNQCIGQSKKRAYDGIPSSGGLAQYISLDVSRVYPVSEELSLEEAAFAEPLACCVHSLKRVRINYGSDVVVVGAGIMGQLHAILARLSGARVIVVEPKKERRDLALSLGAHLAVDPTAEDEQAYFKKISGGLGPEAVFITIPNPDIAANYIRNIGKMGQVVFYGSFHPNKEIPVDANMVHYSEMILTGAYSPSTEDFFEASRLLSKKLVDVSSFISKRFSLEEAQAAFEASLSDENYRVLIKLD
jgi:L-iditol 2-dehydrogenase